MKRYSLWSRAVQIGCSLVVLVACSTISTPSGNGTTNDVNASNIHRGQEVTSTVPMQSQEVMFSTPAPTNNLSAEDIAYVVYINNLNQRIIGHIENLNTLLPMDYSSDVNEKILSVVHDLELGVKHRSRIIPPDKYVEFHGKYMKCLDDLDSLLDNLNGGVVFGQNTGMIAVTHDAILRVEERINLLMQDMILPAGIDINSVDTSIILMPEPTETPSSQATDSQLTNVILYSVDDIQYAMTLPEGVIHEGGKAFPKGSVLASNGYRYWIELERDPADKWDIVPFDLVKEKKNDKRYVLSSKQIKSIISNDFIAPGEIFPLEMTASKDGSLIYIQACADDLPRMPCGHYSLNPENDELNYLNITTYELTAWLSPDGQYLLYPGDMTYVFTKRVENNKIDMNVGYIVDIVWLSDGRFVYASPEAIQLAEPSKKKITTLSNDIAARVLLSPHEDAVIYAVLENNTYKLIYINLDGSNSYTVGSIPAAAYNITWR